MTNTAANYLTALAADTDRLYGGDYGQLASAALANETDRSRNDSAYEIGLTAFAAALGIPPAEIDLDSDGFFEDIENRQAALDDAGVRAALRAAATTLDA